MGGEKEEEEEEEDGERAEEDQGELLFAKAVFFDNFGCAGSIIGARAQMQFTNPVAHNSNYPVNHWIQWFIEFADNWQM